MLAYLVKEGLLTAAEFESHQYASPTLYLRGKPSPWKLAVTLRRDSYLSHGSALAVRGLAEPRKTVYANQEQAPKPSGVEITQAGIDRAFSGQQRQSSYLLHYAGTDFVLLSGKNTDRAGVTTVRLRGGESVDVTGLERTLIDIVVRPAYARGITEVAKVYRKVASRIAIGEMLRLLARLDHAYPYHQSIGFLLQRAGRPERDCAAFKKLGIEFNFYLDYAMERPQFDSQWRIYYPRELA